MGGLRAQNFVLSCFKISLDSEFKTSKTVVFVVFGRLNDWPEEYVLRVASKVLHIWMMGIMGSRRGTTDKWPIFLRNREDDAASGND